MADQLTDEQLSDQAYIADKVLVPQLMRVVHGQTALVASSALLSAMIACINQVKDSSLRKALAQSGSATLQKIVSGLQRIEDASKDAAKH